MQNDALSRYFLEFSVMQKIFYLLSAFYALLGIFMLFYSFVTFALACMLIGVAYLSALLLVRCGSLNGCMRTLHINGLVYAALGVFFFGTDYGFQFYSLHSIAFAYVGVFSNVFNVYAVCALATIFQTLLYLLAQSPLCQNEHIFIFGHEAGFFFYMFHLISLAFMFFGVVVAMRSKLYASVIEKSLEHFRPGIHSAVLSGLLERVEFDEYLESITSAQSANIALVDIDHFRKINDFYGYSCGDEVIITAAELLQTHLPNAVITRWGGEEFLVFSLHLGAEEFFGGCKDFLEALKKVEFARCVSASASIGCLCIRSDFHTFAMDEYLSKLEKNLSDAKTAPSANKIITSNF